MEHQLCRGVAMAFKLLFEKKSKSPCLYVHCYAHKLNLALVYVCSDIRVLSDVLGLMQAIHSFLTASPLRHDVLKQKQSDAGVTILEIPRQSNIRWICKHKAVEIFKNKFVFIVSALADLSKPASRLTSQNGKERAETTSLLMQFLTFKVIFVLHLLDKLLPLLNSISKYLQDKSADMATAFDLIKSTRINR